MTTERDFGDGGRRYHAIEIPRRSDGVGEALRRAYHASSPMTDGFSDILTRLDNISARH